jgi:hypothetical protein
MRTLLLALSATAWLAGCASDALFPPPYPPPIYGPYPPPHHVPPGGPVYAPPGPPTYGPHRPPVYHPPVYRPPAGRPYNPPPRPVPPRPPYAPSPAPIYAPPPGSSGGAREPTADQCGASALQNLVGRSTTDIPVPVNPERRRVYCTTCPVTRDYNPGRLNIVYDQQTRIVREVKCG